MIQANLTPAHTHAVKRCPLQKQKKGSGGHWIYTSNATSLPCLPSLLQRSQHSDVLMPSNLSSLLATSTYLPLWGESGILRLLHPRPPLLKKKKKKKKNCNSIKFCYSVLASPLLPSLQVVAFIHLSFYFCHVGLTAQCNLYCKRGAPKTHPSLDLVLPQQDSIDSLDVGV